MNWEDAEENELSRIIERIRGLRGTSRSGGGMN